MASLKYVCLLVYCSTFAIGSSAFAGHVELLLSTDDNIPTEAMVLTKLARQYENAEGIPRDYAFALELYCQAAKLGYADAQYALGWMYANGRGVARDDDVAALLFHTAAQQGHVQAKTMTHYVRSGTIKLPACKSEEISKVVEQQAVLLEKQFPRGQVFDLVEKLSPLYRIDPNLVLAIISVESGFNAHAVSPKNAQGLMQLLPETAQRFGVKDSFNIEQNLKGGIAYLQWLLAYFKGNVVLVAAAYNAGEKAVEKYRGVPPYPETVDYVKRITGLYPKPSHPFQRHIVEASAVVMR
ncbi:transglycosylase SLT domain-containing protein [Solimicrobium silvestre]|uniref:Transglycosylase SLT domain n=1 Tax=Solimicrobium silvestre TaxID=2099400 RepID=A0A2S9GTC0_9BURK|nr:transglycosylase SLT domain-containing protein [Solimicrobium silvestre]PRC90946.1 Transglycosylase SLT domain [Solimicrobium silvestre]